MRISRKSRPAKKKAAKQEQLTTIDVSELRPGVLIQSPIYDERQDRNVLLLGSSTKLTQAILDQLHRRGVSRVRLECDEWNRICEAEGRPVPGSSAEPTAEAEPPAVEVPKKNADVSRFANQAEEVRNRADGIYCITRDSFIHRLRQTMAVQYDERRLLRLSNEFDYTVTEIEQVFESMSTTKVIDAEVMYAIAKKSLEAMVEDIDVFVATGLLQRSDHYPSGHCVQTAMLSMAVGTELGLPYHKLIDLGIGCLFHDMGMVLINSANAQSGRQLGQVEFLEITKHPTVAYDLLQNLEHVSIGARMVAYQMHERMDGSGYPRQRRGDQIHPLARIASVVDSYIAMISPRPHRPALLPYKAILELLFGVRNCLYDDKVVRALLKTVSLFPIGSYVAMTDGRVGQVLRAGKNSYTQPVVELWEASDLLGDSEIVDLAKLPDLKIKHPINSIKFSDGGGLIDLEGWESQVDEVPIDILPADDPLLTT